MKILLVYPQCPDTFWSFKYALKFISKKAVFPPLGLLTVAALLPEHWEKRLIDMNVSPLKDTDLLWADYVMISAMSVQQQSVRKLIERCKSKKIKMIAGGPLFTATPEDFQQVDHLVLNEAEVTLPLFLEDLQKGEAKHLYSTNEWADLQKTPIPLWGLVDFKKYGSMNIQYSRGCPFNCDFCNITVLYGRTPRTKTKEQILAELESLYRLGWRGGVFFVDDNFIGNKKKLKKEILPPLIEWMKKKKYPFTFSTEVSVDLSDDKELLQLMVEAGFDQVFVGIETPHEESLRESSKHQNKNRDLIKSVRIIQSSGLEVQGGFILGFDSDPPSIFERLIKFIQDSGIATAMVGLLNAPRGTRLYERLVKEGRLLKESSGDNTDFTINFIPKMNYENLLHGYKMVLKTIYSPKHYYQRAKRFLKEFNFFPRGSFRLRSGYIQAFLKSIILLGIINKERLYYWRLFFWSLFRRPRLFPLAITLSIYGFHFRKIFENYLHQLEEKISPTFN